MPLHNHYVHVYARRQSTRLSGGPYQCYHRIPCTQERCLVYLGILPSCHCTTNTCMSCMPDSSVYHSSLTPWDLFLSPQVICLYGVPGIYPREIERLHLIVKPRPVQYGHGAVPHFPRSWSGFPASKSVNDKEDWHSRPQDWLANHFDAERS